MQYRKLGQTGMTTSVVGVGAWQFGGEWGQKFDIDQVRLILDAARHMGINLIDTAECYGDHLSEQLIGEAIVQDRDHWIVATKFGHKFLGHLERGTDFSAVGVVKQLEASLKALRIDRIDLYQAHGVSQETFDDDSLWSELEKQKQIGKIRSIGVSIGFDPMPLERTEVEAVQTIYNRLDQDAEEAVLPACQKKNLGVLARVPLASGFLSDRYKPGQRWPHGDVRQRRKPEDIDRRLKQVEQIGRNQVPNGANLSAWALSWCLKNPAVTTVIPGCKSVEQVEANAAAADLDIQQAAHPQATELESSG